MNEYEFIINSILKQCKYEDNDKNNIEHWIVYCNNKFHKSLSSYFDDVDDKKLKKEDDMNLAYMRITICSNEKYKKPFIKKGKEKI